MSYVFIVGLGGTGTKLTMNILNRNPKVNICDDMHILAPRWLRQDFVFKAKRLGSLQDDDAVRKVVELMFSGRLEGNFWSKSGGIHKLSPAKIEERILASERTYAGILSILIEEDAALNKKPIAGARLPVNIVCVPKLLEWFPDSKVIHLIRDPRAVHMSRVKKDIRSSSAPHLILNLKRLPFTCQQTKATVKIHRRYHTEENYRLVKFEDIVNNPKDAVKQLCDFLGVELYDEMLSPPVDSTAYVQDGAEKAGIDKDASSRWMNHIPRVSKTLLEWFLKNEMREMGYLGT